MRLVLTIKFKSERKIYQKLKPFFVYVSYVSMCLNF
jgi:hypothetical protein